jgi:hypothetical protein
MKNIFTTLAVLAVLTIAAAAMAEPVDNVSGKRHPNLAAAQHLTTAAYQKIVAAQQANEFDMAGHAQRAKDLLDQANNELKQAAGAANTH